MALKATTDNQAKMARQDRQTGQPHSISLRLARVEDAHDIVGFYAYYVEQTTVNFEYDIPTEEDFARRIEQISQKYPFIVAELDNSKVVGYIFAHALGERPAYSWSAATSIYLNPDMRGRHIGSALYAALEPLLCAQHVVKLFSCITVRRDDSLDDINGMLPQLHDLPTDSASTLGGGERSGTDTATVDPHLPLTSPRFHAALGFKPVGRNYASGYKLGRWYDKLWMEKSLQPLPAKPELIIPIGQLPHDLIKRSLMIGTRLLG
ncbi:GNAT family N-acetyltransferase [Bifidobacterium sp. ESL0732]|uniref:GNAT family N-acetyltransferase n=1 Tax=Bifidobacterium sp. ESL0732 TaxID=2983222 RepID=UPI0023F89D2D|nr:GNAT family N-acetyltransferase [Bifidobacterium sp. ESL0732]WEV63439.1 GNAT family N-acetyltransferase [Bifidobacterium sp. ESL0732]